MNDIIAVMEDVSGLLTRGSDAARKETRRIIAEREHRAAANAQTVADQPVTTAIPVRLRKWSRFIFSPR